MGVGALSPLPRSGGLRELTFFTMVPLNSRISYLGIEERVSAFRFKGLVVL